MSDVPSEDRGAATTLRDSRIKAVNKYLGPDNYVVSSRPVDGRSGGGLFDRFDGMLGAALVLLIVESFANFPPAATTG